MHMHTCTHAHMHTCTHAHMHTWSDVRMHGIARTHARTHTTHYTMHTHKLYHGDEITVGHRTFSEHLLHLLEQKSIFFPAKMSEHSTWSVCKHALTIVDGAGYI